MAHLLDRWWDSEVSHGLGWVRVAEQNLSSFPCWYVWLGITLLVKIAANSVRTSG